MIQPSQRLSLRLVASLSTAEFFQTLHLQENEHFISRAYFRHDVIAKQFPLNSLVFQKRLVNSVTGYSATKGGSFYVFLGGEGENGRGLEKQDINH